MSQVGGLRERPSSRPLIPQTHTLTDTQPQPLRTDGKDAPRT